MPLKLRPTGLGSGIDKDRPDYTVLVADGMSAAFTRPAAVPTKAGGVAVGSDQSRSHALRTTVRRLPLVS